MDNDWQTWAALGIVALAVALMVRRAWRRRGSHEGCGCVGAQTDRELKALKRRLRQ